VYLQAPDADTACDAAAELCSRMRKRMLWTNLTKAPADGAEAARWITVLLREARLRDLVIVAAEFDASIGGSSVMSRLLEAASAHPGLIVLSARTTCDIPGAGQLGVQQVTIPWPSVPERVTLWGDALARVGVRPADAQLERLARRYRVTRGQVAEAAALSAAAKGMNEDAGGSDSAPQEERIRTALRAVGGAALSDVADRVEPVACWDDLVLPSDAIAQLRELCARVECREEVITQWGFGATMARGSGTAALFAGGSGTGKTMAVEVVARALGLDLYRVDLARVVSKYIGETEKNLDRVFSAAAQWNVVLLFDEADALFGKRSEVQDAHDRYANIEISYLLQRIEQYDGVAILTTNLADNLDGAFTRRLAFHVHFAFPDEPSRLAIWERAWPQQVPIGGSVDRHALARDLKLAGGSIRNIAIASAYLAAAEGSGVEHRHVAGAVRREHQKSGGSFTLGPAYAQPGPDAREE